VLALSVLPKIDCPLGTKINIGGTIFGRTLSLNNHVVLPLSAQIVAAENGNIYLAWAEKNNSLNNDTVLMFKRISQYYFDRR